MSLFALFALLPIGALLLSADPLHCYSQNAAGRPALSMHLHLKCSKSACTLTPNAAGRPTLLCKCVHQLRSGAARPSGTITAIEDDLARGSAAGCAPFFVDSALFSRCRCHCWSLLGGVELRGGDQGGCVDAGAVPLSSGGMGGLLARLQRLRRRSFDR